MAKQGEAAYAYFLKGYNCSQSVVAAFAPQLGLSEEMALRMSAGFGAGIGRMREVCGAFCGVVTVLSLVYADPADPQDKSRMYALVQEAARLYRARNGGDSIICRELLAKAGAAPSGGTKAEARTADYYKKRPCPELCRLCADLCAEFIAAHPELNAEGRRMASAIRAASSLPRRSLQAGWDPGEAIKPSAWSTCAVLCL